MNTQTYKNILLSKEDRVAVITHNRPEASNAFARDSYAEIRSAILSCEEDPDIGCIVITGAGKHFSAGGDIVRFKMLIDTEQYLTAEGISFAGEMTTAIRRCKKPVIAMVNGVATGAGLSLALACDFRFVTPKSKMIMGFINMGLPGDTGSLYFLPRLIGVPRATELMMTGRPVGGEEAVAIGLANRLCEIDELEQDTMAFAKKLAHAPSKALAKQKSMVNTLFFNRLDEYSAIEASDMAECSRSHDFAEAVNAYLEKRSPVFTGE